VTSTSGTGFGKLQKYLEKQLADRQHRLSLLGEQVSSARHLTVSDRSILQSDLATETAGIDALATKVPKDTTIAELTADGESMYDLRVYVVMSPQVYLTITADNESFAEETLAASQPKLAALIRYEQMKGKDVRGARIADADFVKQVADAEHDTAGVAAAVLRTGPRGWPANRTIFTNATSSLHQGNVALVSARSDVKTILRDLGV
jgi:hypothetical protein